jgi:hypothetical protein
MKAQAAKTIETVNSLAKAEEIIITRLTSIAWKIAYTSLWNGTDFSRTENQKTKTAIRQFLLGTDSIEKNYEEFVQRVLLARQYIINNPGKYLPVPSEWLNENNKLGFAGTQKWFQQMQQKREAIPAFRNEWRDFGWAIWQVNGKGADRYFHQWRSYYAEKNQSMLNLYLATVANSSGWLREEATVCLFLLPE